MFTILYASFKDFKKSYKQCLTVEFIYMLLTSFLFVPFISLLFNWMLKVMGTGSLLNADVYKFGLSSSGIIGMLLISFLVVIVLLMEFGALIIIAQKRYFNRYVFVSEALLSTYQKLPKLLGVGMIQFSLLLFLIIPFVDLPVIPALLDFNVPIFLATKFHESYVVLITYLAIILFIVYLFTRLIFTLHFIFIDEKSILGAMNDSWRLTKHKQNKLTVLLNLCLLNITIFVIGLLAMTFISYLTHLFDTKVVGDLIGNYLTTFSSYLTMVSSLVLIPINIIVITRLFYRFKKNKGDVIKDYLSIQKNTKLCTWEEQLTRVFTNKKKTLTAVVIVLLTVIFFISYTVNDNLVYLKWDVAVAAHRGDWQDAPENSMSSIQSAINKGIDAVEVDVQMTKDGVIVLNHDNDLKRVADNSARVKDLTYEELTELNIGRLYGEAFREEKIPTLDQVLEVVQHAGVTIIIDIKPLDLDERSDLAEKVVQLIEKHEMEDLTYVQSFDSYLLQEIRNDNNSIKIGQILYLAAGNLSTLDVDFYTIRKSMLTERFIKNARKQNREVWVWTVNLERNMKEVLKYDIDGIITDYPEKVQNMLGIEFLHEE
ncbi:glycerophosphodiester phosphodiesterase family protein [Aquibacillus albus]|uniref:Glycerophosphoryl diester phosphodiesterase n=1 Tax=Aquibacillus albus TaxID=1168171 RepID=A0ABS2MXY9_9BACI|nr:glycerophosphodiester phosphodiesterase family protein [Aquibacillus albus]MBM7570763.1 glycerophosphoryl diester phosphodiesterase [Aquibacillus albus]